MENSYQSLKRDLAEDYKKHKTKYQMIFIFISLVVIVFSIFSIKVRIDSKNDYRVKDLMREVQFSLDHYYEDNNKVFPDDLKLLTIKYTDSTYKIISPSEIEFMGYRIQYAKEGAKNFKLSTTLKIGNHEYAVYAPYNY